MLKDLREYIQSKHGKILASDTEILGELCYEIGPDHLISFMKFLRDDAECRFDMLMDVCGVDYPDRPKRFDVVYHLLSLRHNQRVRVKVALAEGQTIKTVTGLFKAAGWFEREAWDMYGIIFEGHPDMRRLLTDYGFEGHPLRKDFPLTGYVELRYDQVQHKVVYEPVALPQDFRNFDFLSPWEGPLPGDEKVA